MSTVQEPAPRPRLPHPVLNALLICDNAVRDTNSGKITLEGIFEQIFSGDFPAEHPQLVVYAKFTDARGEYETKLDLIQLETGTIAASVVGTVRSGDRMAAVEVVFDARNVPLPEPGLYEWRLTLNGRYLGSKTFAVLRSDPPAGD